MPSDVLEKEFWGACANTFHEEQKQIVYASRMGLYAIWDTAHPPLFDLDGRSVIDIGGGPVSLLLKCMNYGRAVVADPGEYPYWVRQRYQEVGIEYWRTDGEDIEGYTFDEAWMYNVLQHTRDPELVVGRARALAQTIRLFEWVDVDPYPGHPHRLTSAELDRWLGAPGYTARLNESGAVGKAYYGVFAGFSEN